MPSDRFYDDMYEAEDRWREQEKNRRRSYYEKMFKEMTIDEKVDFLLEEFIQSKLIIK